MYTKTFSELAGSSGARRVISKLVTLTDAVLTVSVFFCFAYRWMNNCKHMFRSGFLLFWATNPLFGNMRKQHFKNNPRLRSPKKKN